MSTQTKVRATRIENQRTSSLTLGTSRGLTIGAITALVVIALMWLLPILWGVATSLKSEKDAAGPALSAPAQGWTQGAF